MNTSVLVQPQAATTSAILKISGLRLLLPQKEIRALGAADDVEVRDAESPGVGWLQHAQQRWPVYCLSQELSLLAAIPAERRACVLLDTGAGYAGVLCDDVTIGQQTLGQQYELPPAMRLPDMPILGLMTTDEQGIVCITSAERLTAHLSRLAGV